MKTYQVTLQMGRTDTIEMRGDSLLDVQGLYNALSEAKIKTIKEVVYRNPSPSALTSHYYRELKVLVGNSTANINKFVIVRFMKPLLSKQAIIDKCKQCLTINGLRVDNVQNIIRHN